MRAIVPAHDTHFHVRIYIQKGQVHRNDSGRQSAPGWKEAHKAKNCRLILELTRGFPRHFIGHTPMLERTNGEGPHPHSTNNEVQRDSIS